MNPPRDCLLFDGCWSRSFPPRAAEEVNLKGFPLLTKDWEHVRAKIVNRIYFVVRPSGCLKRRVNLLSRADSRELACFLISVLWFRPGNERYFVTQIASSLEEEGGEK